MPSGGLRYRHDASAVSPQDAAYYRRTCKTLADWRMVRETLHLSRSTIARIKNETGAYSPERVRLRKSPETARVRAIARNDRLMSVWSR